jgi:hypothetical protein
VNKLLRLIGISFIIISFFSVGLLYVTSVNYVNYTETRATIPHGIMISEVRVPLIEDESLDYTVQVIFNITNPSNLPVYIINIEYFFYMDNKSDTRSFVEKYQEIVVGTGLLHLEKYEAYIVRPGETVSIPANLTISGGSVFTSRLNTTTSGLYFPYVFGTVRYTFEDIDLIEIVRGVFFSGGSGIKPYNT